MDVRIEALHQINKGFFDNAQLASSYKHHIIFPFSFGSEYTKGIANHHRQTEEKISASPDYLLLFLWSYNRPLKIGRWHTYGRYQHEAQNKCISPHS